MRNFARMKPMLDMVRATWIHNPDIRLGQLLMNCEEGDDLYFIEDAELFRRLDKMHRIGRLEPATPMPAALAEKNE